MKISGVTVPTNNLSNEYDVVQSEKEMPENSNQKTSVARITEFFLG